MTKDPQPGTRLGMKTLTLDDGRELPSFGLGTWRSAREEVYRAVRRAMKWATAITLSDGDGDVTAIAAIDPGYRYIDGSFWCPEGSPSRPERIFA